MGLFEKFGFSVIWAALAVLALAAYPAFKLILRILLKQYNQFATKPTDSKTSEGKDYVRQTDLFHKLTKDQRAIHKEAEAFEAKGAIREAAVLFEQIGFQRRSIDLLENAKMIDEACAVLVRINAIQRAGVVFERNGMFEKAAMIFKQVKQFGKAGDMYLRLADKNFHALMPAAEVYSIAQDREKQLQCLIRLCQFNMAVELMRQAQRLDLLAPYLDSPAMLAEMGTRLKAHEFEKIIAAMPPEPLIMMRLVTCLEYATPSLLPMDAVLAKVQSNPELHSFFWQMLLKRLPIEKVIAQIWDAKARALLSNTITVPGDIGPESLSYMQKVLAEMNHPTGTSNQPIAQNPRPLEIEVEVELEAEDAITLDLDMAL